MTYKLEFEGRIFHTGINAPKLIRLGSGEILQWRNTVPDPMLPNVTIAIYRIAEIEEFSYIHMDTDIKAGV